MVAVDLTLRTAVAQVQLLLALTVAAARALVLSPWKMRPLLKKLLALPLALDLAVPHSWILCQMHRRWVMALTRPLLKLLRMVIIILLLAAMAPTRLLLKKLLLMVIIILLLAVMAPTRPLKKKLLLLKKLLLKKQRAVDLAVAVVLRLSKKLLKMLLLLKKVLLLKKQRAVDLAVAVVLLLLKKLLKMRLLLKKVLLLKKQRAGALAAALVLTTIHRSWISFLTSPLWIVAADLTLVVSMTKSQPSPPLGLAVALGLCP
jgi:hypothetical protein